MNSDKGTGSNTVTLGIDFPGFLPNKSEGQSPDRLVFEHKMPDPDPRDTSGERVHRNKAEAIR